MRYPADHPIWKRLARDGAQRAELAAWSPYTLDCAYMSWGEVFAIGAVAAAICGDEDEAFNFTVYPRGPAMRNRRKQRAAGRTVPDLDPAVYEAAQAAIDRVADDPKCSTCGHRESEHHGAPCYRSGEDDVGCPCMRFTPKQRTRKARNPDGKSIGQIVTPKRAAVLSGMELGSTRPTKRAPKGAS